MVEKKMEGTRVLVTGITGFLGSQIARLLLERSYRVRGTVRDKANHAKLDPLLLALRNQENLELVEADLLVSPEEVWQTAIMDCQHVIHAASPFPLVMPKDEDEVIKPAVEGIGKVLSACKKCGVKSLVVTSSMLAIMNFHTLDKTFDESDWANLDDNTAYAKSKVLEEKAVWDFHRQNPQLKIAVINPGFILGPSLVRTDFASGDFVRKIMRGELAALPQLYFAVGDVRDIAEAHLAAMENPISNGKRYICFSGEYVWLEDMAKILKAEFEKDGYNKISTEVMKECPVKDKAQVMYMRWKRTFKFDNARICKELGMKFRGAKEMIVEMARSFIRLGIVPDLVQGKKEQLAE